MKRTFVRDCTSFCRQLISFLRYWTSLSFALSNVWKTQCGVMILPVDDNDVQHKHSEIHILRYFYLSAALSCY